MGMMRSGSTSSARGATIRPRHSGGGHALRRKPSSVRRPRGQAVVELALTLPILLLLMLGLINLGLMVNGQIILTHAAWEGARAGATLDRSKGEGDDAVRGAVRRAISGLDADALRDPQIAPAEAERNAAPWPGPRGSPLTLTLEYPLTLYLPFPLPVTLRASATTRIEYQNPP